jgi:predicted nuclease of predicted toxin-antitoxin system
MRFLVDECTGPSVARWLVDLGHEVCSVYDDFRGIKDDAVLLKAVVESRILITNDKDFGEKIFRERLPHCGIVLLRLDDERVISQIASLRALLEMHADRLVGNFVVVTSTRIRFAAQ